MALLPNIGPITSTLNIIDNGKRVVDMFRKNKKFNPSDPNSQRYEQVQQEQVVAAPTQPTTLAPVRPIQAAQPRPAATAMPVTPGPKMATVKNDTTGDRRAVAVDSEEAKAAFAQGYRLERPDEAPAGNTPTPIATSTGTQPTPSGGGTAPTEEQAVDEGGTVDYVELARKAGEAGLSFDDYMGVLKGTASVTEEQRKKVLSDLGIPDLVKEYYEKPSLDTQSLYNTKYDELGLNTVKEDIAKLDAEKAALDAQFNEAFQQYNNNPFLSAGTRDFRIRTAAEAHDRKIANIESRRQSYIDVFDRGVDELEKYITRESTKFENDQTMTANKLNYLFTEANRVVTSLEDDQDRQLYRYVPDFLKSTADQKSEENALNLQERQLRIDKLYAELAETVGDEDEFNKFLSVSEAKDLGVPYGTTKGQAMAMLSQAENPKIPELREKVTLLDSLLTSEGLSGSVGSYGVSRWTPFSSDKAERQEFAAGVNQLISKETVDTLVNLKERGGTLGALSDQERVLLQSAATKIGTWMQRDENGQPTGKFEVSEKAFKEELENIKQLTLKAIERAGGSIASPEVGQSQGDDLDRALNEMGTFPNDLSKSEENGSITLGSRLAKANNNPGNLRFAGQPGATQGEGGFARFPSPQAGYEALKRQIALDAGRGHTLEGFIKKYAPPNENDTDLYIEQMVKATGASRKTPVKNINLDLLARAMAKKESSSYIA